MMTFPEFFELMYDCIGGDTGQAEFFRTLFDQAMKGAQVPSPYVAATEVHCNRLARGDMSLGLANLRLLVEHMDRGSFRKFVEHAAPDTQGKPARERLIQKYLALVPNGDTDPRTDLGRAYANLFYQVLEGELDRAKEEKKRRQAERRRLKLDQGGPVKAPVEVRLPAFSLPTEAPWYNDWKLGVTCPLWNDPVKRATIVNVTTDLASQAVTTFLTLDPRPALGRAERIAYAGATLRSPQLLDLSDKEYLTFQLRNQGLQRLQVVLEPRSTGRATVTIPCYGPSWEQVVIPLAQLCPGGDRTVLGIGIQAYGPASFVSDQMMGWFSVRDLKFQ